MIAIRWKDKLYGAIVKINPTTEVNLVNDVLANIDSKFISFKLRVGKSQVCEDRQMNHNERSLFQTNENIIGYLSKRWSDFSSIVDLGYYLPQNQIVNPTHILDLDGNILKMADKQINLTKTDLKIFLNQKVFETIF